MMWISYARIRVPLKFELISKMYLYPLCQLTKFITDHTGYVIILSLICVFTSNCQSQTQSKFPIFTLIFPAVHN